MKTTIDEILSDFSAKNAHGEHNRPVTIWLPVDAKERYDKLQKMSHRQFAQKAREALIALIAAAEAKSA